MRTALRRTEVWTGAISGCSALLISTPGAVSRTTAGVWSSTNVRHPRYARSPAEQGSAELEISLRRRLEDFQPFLLPSCQPRSPAVALQFAWPSGRGPAAGRCSLPCQERSAVAHGERERADRRARGMILLDPAKILRPGLRSLTGQLSPATAAGEETRRVVAVAAGSKPAGASPRLAAQDFRLTGSWLRLTTQSLRLVPGGQARDAASLAFPAKTHQRRQPDHGGNRQLNDGTARQKAKPDPEHRPYGESAAARDVRRAARSVLLGIMAPRPDPASLAISHSCPATWRERGGPQIQTCPGRPPQASPAFWR